MEGKGLNVFSKSGSLTEPGIHQLGKTKWPTSSRDLLVARSLELQLKEHITPASVGRSILCNASCARTRKEETWGGLVTRGEHSEVTGPQLVIRQGCYS